MDMVVIVHIGGGDFLHIGVVDAVECIVVYNQVGKGCVIEDYASAFLVEHQHLVVKG